MKTSTKITSIVIIFFLIIATVIIGRTMIGNHFKKKFSKRPPPGIIITTTQERVFENIDTGKFNVVDARSRERFEGKVAEPRKGLRSGSIKNSFCLPFSELINEDHTFVSIDKIKEKFESIRLNKDKNTVFSCGSGVTASVLALAYSLINAKYIPTIYDGSWAEYGKN